VSQIYSGRRAALRQFRPDTDAIPLFNALTPLRSSSGVHLQGGTPYVDDFVAGLWRGAHALWVICRPNNDAALGVAALSSVDHRNGFGWFSIAVDISVERPGFAGEAAGLAINFIFDTFPLRMLLFDISAEVFDSRFRSGVDRFFSIDGIRRDLLYRDGHYEDVYLLSVTRDQWDRDGRLVMDRVLNRKNDPD